MLKREIIVKIFVGDHVAYAKSSLHWAFSTWQPYAACTFDGGQQKVENKESHRYHITGKQCAPSLKDARSHAVASIYASLRSQQEAAQSPNDNHKLMCDATTAWKLGLKPDCSYLPTRAATNFGLRPSGCDAAGQLIPPRRGAVQTFPKLVHPLSGFSCPPREADRLT